MSAAIVRAKPVVIRGGTVVDPVDDREYAADIALEDGLISAIGTVPDRFRSARTIDARGLLIAPGLVDLAARLREPGYEYKATLESELAAAVAGGVTSLACPPDTDPPLDEPGLVEMLKYRAQTLALSRVYPVGALTQALAGERITEMAELNEAGCIAFSHADHPVTDTRVLLRTMLYAASFDFPVWLRPQDPHLARGGVAHGGEVATRLGLSAIPVCAETIAIDTLVTLARVTGARVHLCRLSTAEGVAQVRAARAGGLAITCDVAIHHVHLCDRDIGYFDAQSHLVPPLRSVRDRDALRAALADGTIDAVCSDHTPVDDDAKQLPFAQSEPGATGLELLLPLTLKWATEMSLSRARALSRITCAPARILGVPAGRLTLGAPADLCLFDPIEDWVVSPQTLVSQGKNTPFAGLPMVGRVRHTIVGGEAVFSRGAGWSIPTT
ncbi:MAG: dihydroorotase [Proteobacteria bacterium]|nr:dihydroorotase [Burkholderiales bacterium]